MTDSKLIAQPGTRSRCPICDHPNTGVSAERSEPLPFDEIRHAVTFDCDKGHCWTTSWTTEATK